MALLKKLFIDRRDLLPIAKTELKQRAHVFGRMEASFVVRDGDVIELRHGTCAKCGLEAIITEYPYDYQNGGHLRGKAFEVNCVKGGIKPDDPRSCLYSFRSMEIRRYEEEKKRKVAAILKKLRIGMAPEELE